MTTKDIMEIMGIGLMMIGVGTMFIMSFIILTHKKNTKKINMNKKIKIVRVNKIKDYYIEYFLYIPSYVSSHKRAFSLFNGF